MVYYFFLSDWTKKKKKNPVDLHWRRVLGAGSFQASNTLATIQTTLKLDYNKWKTTLLTLANA